MRWALCVLLLGGCRQIFGIDTPGVADDANGGPIDAPQIVIDTVPADAAQCFGAGFGRVCFTSIPSGTMSLASQINTDSSALCSMTSDHANWCVIAATTLSIGNGTTTAVGARPLVLVATDMLTISGTLDVASHRNGNNNTPAGSVPVGNTTLCDPGTPASGHGGGAGGSFATAGGDGGAGGAGGAGGVAGALQPTTAMRGGCPGQDGKASGFGAKGLGGGAVYLIAGTRILISGVINASGAAGSAGANIGGGGGAGAGGLIGLDAPIVDNNGAIFANGGGGGEGASTSGPSGNGGESVAGAVAAGGTGALVGGDGGAGGVATTMPVPGSSAGTNDGGGGGGGSVGAIKLFQAMTISGGVVSPPPT